MLWKLDDCVSRSRLDECVLDGAHYTCHLHRESMAQKSSPQFSYWDGTHFLWGVIVHTTLAAYRTLCTMSTPSLAVFVVLLAYILLLRRTDTRCCSYDSTYLPSIGGITSIMATVLQLHSAVQEETTHAHSGSCTCNPCTCDPCTCGSTMASVQEETSPVHSASCTCNPCTCDPCTCGSTMASVQEETTHAHSGSCTCNPCTCDPCTC